jgi:hypothetical protein
MKKFLALLLCSAMILCAACTGKTDSTSDSKVSVSSISQSASASTASASDSTSSADNKAEEKDPYADILDNSAEFEVSSDADSGTNIRFSDTLTDGAKVTLGSFVDTLRIASRDEAAKVSSVETTFIDCGSDGNRELLVKATIAASIETWVINFVIKDFGGSYKLIYSGDSWTRSSTEINNAGVIFNSGSNGAASLGYSVSVLTADGRNELAYACSVDFMTDFVYAADENVYLLLYRVNTEDTNLYNGENMMTTYALEYLDTEGVEGTQNIMSGNIIYEGEDVYAADSSVRQYIESNFTSFPGKGIVTVTEAANAVTEKENKLGLTDENLNADDPEDWESLDLDSLLGKG